MRFMKQYIKLLPLLLSVFIAGCSEEQPDDTGAEVKSIEVSYSYDGAEVKALPFNSSSRSVRVDVKVNNQDIWWNIESDASWCKVFDEQHRGDGGFTLNILANDDYSDRTPATLTFVSGQFRGYTMQVSQTGNVFIVNKLFAVGPRSAGTEEVEVSVKDGVEWDIVNCDWITAVKEGSPVSEGGVTKTRVSVRWNENTSAARFGSIGFRRSSFKEADSQFSVFQFGNELTYDESGDIMLPAKECPAVAVKVPSSGVNGVVLPEWITYTTEANADNTITYNLTFEDNPSDTRTIRNSNVSFDIADKDSDVVLPVIKQDYYTVHGITTADGLRLFAKTVNEGGDVSEWQKDGKTILLNNIDMSALTGEWTPIGTADKPFAGVFDGRYRKILNMKSSSPLFGTCEGAELSNIIIDESSEFSVQGEYLTECVAAPLAGKLTDCKVSECTNNASVLMEASSLNEATVAYVSGLVGVTKGNTTVYKSENNGSVTASGKCKTAKAQGKFYVGGIVAMNGGIIDGCTNNGAVSDAAVSYNHSLAGVAAANSGTVQSSKNCGRISVAAVRVVDSQNDVSRYINMGGITGYNMEGGKIAECTNDAALASASDVKLQRVGGVAGYLESAQVSKNVNTANGKCDITGTSTDSRGARQLSLGGLYGEMTCGAALDFSGEGKCSAGPLTVSNYEASADYVIIYIGGMIGHAGLADDISISHPEWNGTITMNLKNNKFAGYALGVGGVIGGVGVFEKERVAGGHLTVEDASVGGIVNILANQKNAMSHKFAGIGGVSGLVSTGGSSFRRCTSETKILQPDYCGKSNGCAQHVGGIAGIVMGGNSEITDCHNTGEIDNEHYNNNPWTGTNLQSGSTAGIIGAYAYDNDYKASIKISGCTNTASVRSYRGMAGGIAGYLRNAEISDCSNTGTMANGSRSYVGGIIGIADNTSVAGCTAICKVGGSSAGSEIYSGGGVVGILWTGSSCENCAYFGDITSLTPTKPGETYGSVAGSTASGSKITGCRFGGTVLGSTVTESNYSSFVAGDSNASISSCSYWNGK